MPYALFMHVDTVTRQIIGSAMQVHRQFGPGLLENVYTLCTGHDLIESGLPVEIHKPLPLTYKHLTFKRAYVLDLLVDDRVIVEAKCVDAISDIHVAQVLTYLRLTGLHVGLIINFNVVRLKDGIRRVVNHYVDDAAKEQ